MRTLFQHPADELAAAVLADIKAAGRFAAELAAFLLTLGVGGALILFGL